jgi:hypothetical protein
MRKSLIAVLTICFTLAITALAQNNSDVLVTSTITDSVAVGGSPVFMQIRSDGQGAYQSIKNKKNYVVKSIIQGIGDWELDTGIFVTSPTRRVFLDFSNPVSGTGPGPNGAPTPPFNSALVRARFLCQASRYGHSMFTIQNGETVSAPLIIGFDDPLSGARYRIHMTPDDGSVFPYLDTDYIDITCTGVEQDGECNRWEMRPNGAKGGCASGDAPCTVKQNRIKLVKVVTSKGKTTEINQGDFYMAFSIDITRP